MTKKIKGTEIRPRLRVFRSHKHIYAQIIDDINNKIIVTSSSIAPELQAKISSSANCESAQVIGKDIAAKSKSKGIQQVVFDRGSRLYHGRIKALADAAREAGMNF